LKKISFSMLLISSYAKTRYDVKKFSIFKKLYFLAQEQQKVEKRLIGHEVFFLRICIRFRRMCKYIQIPCILPLKSNKRPSYMDLGGGGGGGGGAPPGGGGGARAATPPDFKTCPPLTREPPPSRKIRPKAGFFHIILFKNVFSPENDC
jgi:hypothetical protein